MVQQGSYENCNMIFLDAPSGTGMGFVIKIILKKSRPLGKIAVATVSSGIADTLL